MRGKVKFYERETGYGVIVAEDGEHIIFKDASFSKKDSMKIKPGAVVEFDEVEEHIWWRYAKVVRSVEEKQ